MAGLTSLGKGVAILLGTIALGACAPDRKTESGCILPPQGFTQKELVGTWISYPRVAGNRFDTLVIRGDGFYRQIIHIDDPVFDYESEWLPWHLEYAEDGVPYLHLTGMRLYAYLPGLIEKGVIGGGDQYFLDWCRPVIMPGGKEIFEGVQMPPGIGVLVVKGTPNRFAQPPRGVTLEPLSVSDTYSWWYEVEE